MTANADYAGESVVNERKQKSSGGAEKQVSLQDEAAEQAVSAPQLHQLSYFLLSFRPVLERSRAQKGKNTQPGG